MGADLYASSKPTTVVILHSGQEGVVAGLAAEISALGMTPVTVAAEPEPSDTPTLETVARESDAVAGIRVYPTGKGVEVWVSDPVSGVNMATDVVVEKENARTDALLALKAVELLRISLMKITEESTPKPASSSAADTTPERPQPETRSDTPPRLAFGVQPAVTWAFSELPVTMHLHMHVHVRLPVGLGIRIFGLTPTLPMDIRGPEGRATVRVGVVGMGVVYEPLPASRRLQPLVGVAVGPGIMRMRGHAKKTYRDGDELLVFPVGFLTAGLAISLNRVLSIRLDTMVGLAFKRPVVRFVDRGVADWGRPVISGMLGFEAWLF